MRVQQQQLLPFSQGERNHPASFHGEKLPSDCRAQGWAGSPLQWQSSVFKMCFPRGPAASWTPTKSPQGLAGSRKLPGGFQPSLSSLALGMPWPPSMGCGQRGGTESEKHRQGGLSGGLTQLPGHSSADSRAESLIYKSCYPSSPLGTLVSCRQDVLLAHTCEKHTAKRQGMAEPRGGEESAEF